MYKHIHIYTYMHKHMYMFTYILMYTYIYIYMCIYVRTYIYLHTYMYIYLLGQGGAGISAKRCKPPPCGHNQSVATKMSPCVLTPTHLGTVA